MCRAGNYKGERRARNKQGGQGREEGWGGGGHSVHGSCQEINKQNLKPRPGIDLLTSMNSTVVASVRGEGNEKGGGEEEESLEGEESRHKDWREASCIQCITCRSMLLIHYY